MRKGKFTINGMRRNKSQPLKLLTMERGLDSFFASARCDIEAELGKIIKGQDGKERLSYFIEGGKRLRPLLCILAYRASGGGEDGYRGAVELAASIELQHSASLVHDDIIDRDTKRRDASSYYISYGIEDAILMGHRAIVLGFKNALRHDPKIVRTLFDTWDDSLRGEMMDIESRKGRARQDGAGRRRYFDMILKKTASLFAGAAAIGSQEAGAPARLQRIFWEFGECVGVAYQLADDYQDIDKGTDVLPLAWVLGQIDGGKRASIATRIRSGELPSRVLSETGVDLRGTFLKEIRRMQERAKRLAGSSMVPNSAFKSLLRKYPEYLVVNSLG